MSLTYRTNIVAGSILSIFALTYLALSFQIQKFHGMGATPLNAAFIPRLWGVCLLLLSLSLVLRGYRARKAAAQKAVPKPWAGFSPIGICKENLEVILTFVAIGVYTAFLDLVGFTLMSAAYIFFQIIILTPASKKMNYPVAAIVAITASVAIDYLFVVLLSVLLPTGILGW